MRLFMIKQLLIKKQCNSLITQVEVRAVPVDTDALGDDYKRMRRLSRPDEIIYD